MKIEHKTLGTIDFEGLEIRDYTAGKGFSSSVAEIVVPPGARHRTAWSKRSDKYYYVIEGSLRFVLEDEGFELAAGDCCIVFKGKRFNYQNAESTPAKLLLVHTPSFDLAEEVFEDETGAK